MSDKLRQELHERLAHIAEPGKPLLNRVGPDYIDPLVQVIWECIQDRSEDKEAWRQRLSMAMDGWSKEEKDNQDLRARVAELEAQIAAHEKSMEGAQGVITIDGVTHWVYPKLPTSSGEG